MSIIDEEASLNLHLKKGVPILISFKKGEIKALKFRRMDPKELTADEGLLKEKDLENHLEAEPGTNKDNATDSKDTPAEKQRKMREIDFRVGPLRLEVLQSDNQVMRALEILVGYDIFKSLKL